jgi:4-hydroxybenzoate polyprenyltransferase
MTVLLVEVFFLIGGGSFLSWYNVWLVLWATLVHWVTFGHNTLMDTARGYDKENPRRKHDPLVSGEIQLDEAHNYVNWLLIFAAFAGLVLILTSPGQQIIALSFMILFIVAGHTYNDGLNKSSVLAFIPYTLAYGSLCSASYFLYATPITEPRLFILSLIYIIFTLIFQVGWEIYLKDITNEKEPNLLRVMKVKVEKGKFKCSFRARLFAYGVKIGVFVPLFLTTFVNIQATVEGVSALVLLVITVVFAVLQIESRDYNYNRDIMFILIEDFASILLLPVVIVGAIGPQGGIAVISMVVYTAVWYILFNMLTWSSPYKPKE